MEPETGTKRTVNADAGGGTQIKPPLGTLVER